MYPRPSAIALALLVGCGAPQKSVPIAQVARCEIPREWTGAFARCAQADLGKIISATGQNVQQSVVDAVTDDLEVDVALEAIAGEAGVDAISCAIAAIESSVPRAVGASAETYYPGLPEARAWLARHLQRRSL